MQKKSLFFFLLGILLMGTQCTKTDSIEEPAPIVDYDCETIDKLCELTAANNDFGFNLLRELHANQRDENIFISPLSISTALSMTLNGADGQTEADMRNTLEYDDLNIQQINLVYRQMLNALPALDNEVQLNIANSIWYKLGYHVRPEFLEANTENYNSEVIELDFTSPSAVETINSWVESKTQGLIDQIITEIPGNVIMYLINAIYFKGSWKTEFDTENTFSGPFTLMDNSQTEVDYMKHPEISLPYFEDDKVQVVDLAYGDSIYSMTLFLPKEGYSLDGLIEDLDNGNWLSWINALEDENIILSMPKFKMEYEKKLNRELSDLGMAIAFTDAADFSNINGTGGLRISEVRHKSFIEVDEKGTEAAAVTVVVIVETSVPLLPEMNLNRPFLYVIRENQTNSVLFVGKMLDPS